MEKTGKNSGYFAIEGSECSGKGSQITLLQELFIQQGRQVIATREPGGTALGEELRAIVKKKYTHPTSPKTTLNLVQAARMQLIDEVIVPARANGVTVISDRMFISTDVYQGYCEKLDLEYIRKRIHEEVSLFPDIVFVLTIDAETTAQRMRERPGYQMDRYDSAGLEFHQKIVEGYKHSATYWGQFMKIVLIDGEQSTEAVHGAIVRTLKDRNFI